jgi:hypothetical protein
MSRDKILTAIAMGVVFLVPMHFKFQRSTHNERQAIRFGFQWFGYMLVFGVSWADMGDMYREHIDEEQDQ